MTVCPACQNEIPSDSQFCGFCGFRLAPIPVEEYRTLSQELAVIPEGVVPLTRRKGDSEEGRPARKAQLVVMADEVALDDTMPGTARQHDALEDTAPAGTAEQLQRRTGRRFPIKVEVSYGSEHNFYTGFTKNMGSGGLFVATHEPVAIGEILELSFTVPGLNHSCTAKCEVCWVREYAPERVEAAPGMGLKFVGLAPDARAAIELFIRHREPIFFDDDF